MPINCTVCPQCKQLTLPPFNSPHITGVMCQNKLCGAVVNANGEVEPWEFLPNPKEIKEKRDDED